MEFLKSDNEDDDHDDKYYSSIYYVDKTTIEKPTEPSTPYTFNVDDVTKRAISKRYWSISTPEANSTPYQKSKLEVRSQKSNKKSRDISNMVTEKVSKVDYAGKNSQPHNQNDYRNNQQNRNLLNRWDLLNSYKHTTDDKIKTPSMSPVTTTKSDVSQSDSVSSTLKTDGEQSNKKEVQSKKNISTVKNNASVKAKASNSTIADSDIVNVISQDASDVTKSPSNLNNDQTKAEKGNVSKSRNSKRGKSTVHSGIITLESSDDESVIEVALPPCPAICIESSDEDTIMPAKNKNQSTPLVGNKKSKVNTPNQHKCTSPVPSVVSSTSDDFITTDCSVLNISNKGQDQDYSFNFQLHGSDLSEEISDFNASSRRKVLLANADSSSKTPSPALEKNLKTPCTPSLTVSALNDAQMFATPKSKGKRNLNSKLKNYTISEENFTPFTDIYESESSDFPDSVVDVPISTPLTRKPKSLSRNREVSEIINVDEDTLIMANVVGVKSPKIGKIVYEEADCTVDSEAGINHQINDAANEKTTLSKCLKDMNKFYDQSWGGENFDHARIQNQMPFSKELWAVDIADKFLTKHKKREVCSHCNKFGHKEFKCQYRQKKCLMCGSNGHSHFRCPEGICLNCGYKRKNGFSAKCPHCFNWKSMKCSTCNIYGHPSYSCPDLWRRYHLTVKNEIPLIEDKSKKLLSNIFCSGCAQKGHTVNFCKVLKTQYNLSSPFVHDYSPVYIPDGVRSSNVDSQSTIKLIPNQIAIEPKAISSKEIQTPFDREISSGTNLKRKSEIGTDQKSPKKMKIFSQNLNTDNQLINHMGTSHVLVSLLQAKMMAAEGASQLENLSMKYRVGYKQQVTALGHSLFLDGELSNQIDFWVEFNDCFNKPTMYHNTTLQVFIPENKHEAIKMLSNDLEVLNTYIGKPSGLHSSLIGLKNQFHKKQIKCEKDSKDLRKISSDINDVCKKLNMILIGQRGLCKGKDTLNKLRDAVYKMTGQISDVIPLDLRVDLSIMYSTVFSSLPREDYLHLLSLDKIETRKAKKQKAKIEKKKIKKVQKQMINPFGSLNPSTSTKKILKAFQITRAKLKNMPQVRSFLFQKTFEDLQFYERQLKNNEFSNNSLQNIKKITSGVFKFIQKEQSKDN
ncbi:zinc finger CCHC-type containing 7 [Arctopsyche grandis]|uniref:zinc finger CCHC-type containing 7 n=1 Tax=Arctopsyche grandis TaxID=121162 RepID=UPI00406D8E13